jgi:hypothetical protein
MNYTLTIDVQTIILLLVLMYVPLWIFSTAKKNSEKINKVVAEAKMRIKEVSTARKVSVLRKNLTGWEDTVTFYANTNKWR